MLRLATVFSGIGAIEHALDRMQIEHEMVFACDNGDVELEMPKIEIEIDSMKQELSKLQNKIKNIELKITDEDTIDYASQLNVMLAGVETELEKLSDQLALTPEESILLEQALLDSKNLLKETIDSTTASKKKKYKEFYDVETSRLSDKAKLFYLLRIAVALDGDGFDITSDSLKSLFSMRKSEAKKIVKAGKDISERLTMINDKLFYLDTNAELKQLSSYSERKKYVDNLYAGNSIVVDVLIAIVRQIFDAMGIENLD